VWSLGKPLKSHAKQISAYEKHYRLVGAEDGGFAVHSVDNNKVHPTGGVISLTSTMISTKMPNQIEVY